MKGGDRDMPQPRKYASAAHKQAAYRQRCAQRPDYKAIPTVPGYRRWNAMRMQALSFLEQVASEMECYYNQRSDSWQDSERGEAFTEAMDSTAETAAALREIALL